MFPVFARLTAAGHAEPEGPREMLLFDAPKAREDALWLRDQGELGAAAVLHDMSAMLAAAPDAYGAELGAERCA
jgi:hypothetical protein